MSATITFRFIVDGKVLYAHKISITTDAEWISVGSNTLRDGDTLTIDQPLIVERSFP